MAKGGVYGSYVMCEFRGGNSWKFQKTASNASEEVKAANSRKSGSNKSSMVWVKESVAKYFGFMLVTPADMLRAATRTKKLKYNGIEDSTPSLASMGATGAGRSVTVKFTKPTTIGGKSVASVKVAMPSSYTMRDMVKMIMETKVSGNVAAIVSPRGKSWTFRTPYNPKAKNRR